LFGIKQRDRGSWRNLVVLRFLFVAALVILPSTLHAQSRPDITTMVTTQCGNNVPVLGGSSGAGNPAQCGSGAIGTSAYVNLGSGVATLLTGTASGSGGPAGTTSPVFITPNLGTPSAITLTHGTGLPIAGITGTGTNVAALLAANASAATWTCSVLSNSTALCSTSPGTGVVTALGNAVNGTGGVLTFSIIGTSGATVPLLNASNTWSAQQVFSSSVTSFGANGGNAGDINVFGSTSGAFALEASATGAPLLTAVPNTAENSILCYSTSTNAISEETSVAGCVPSARELKHIGPELNGRRALDAVMTWIPGSGIYKNEALNKPHDQPYVWVYANEICASDPRLCVRDDKGDVENYDKLGFNAYLLAALQEEHRELVRLRATVAALKKHRRP
jgi:hypothetical protein